MKILHLITSLGNGGAEKNLTRLCVSDKKNQNIIITLIKNNFHKKELKKNQIITYNLDLLHKPLKGLKKLIHIIKSENPKIIMGWMYHSCFILIIVKIFLNNRISIIWNIRHSSVVFLKTKIFTFILAKYLLRIFSHIPNKVIYNSFYSKKIHNSYGYNISNTKVIHNGFKEKIFKQKKSYKRINFGFIGRYSPQKNFEFLFKIISLLKKKKLDFKFYLVGTNVNKNNKKLIELINFFNIFDKIIFLKAKPDISNYYELFDITISASTYGESFPNILAESLLSSTPCLAPNFGENKLILNKGNLLYKKNDLNDFLKKLNKILILKKNKKIWDRFRKEGYFYVTNRFSNDKMISKYLKIYESFN